MSVLDKVRFLVYRVHEKGLEVFLVNSPDNEDEWKMPEFHIPEEKKEATEEVINLDPVEKDGEIIKAVAIEGDWHDLPSIRKMFFKDVSTIKSKIKSFIPHSEKGMFFAVKEAVGKVIPGENSFIEELKEIVVEKNSTKNI